MLVSFLIFLPALGLPWGVLSQVQLQESGSQLVRPTQTLSLTCTISGDSMSANSPTWNWIRQTPGKGLQWLGRTYYRSKWYREYAPSLKSRLVIDPDTSKNQFSLQLTSATTEDTAVYYCAKQRSSGFDYWGQGTMVTVSSASPSAPNLFPLVTCEGFQPDESLVAMGCLAKDFLPVPVTFSWTYKNTSAVGSQAVKAFPPVLRDGKYAASSQLFLPSADVLQGTDEFVRCSVKHSNGNKDLNVPLPVSREPLPPKVTVFIPPRDAFSNTNPRTSKLICQATGFKPNKISLSWLREGKQLQSGFTTGETELEQGSKPATYSVTSMLSITESDWLSQHTYTCQVLHNGVTVEKNVSSLCNPGPSTNVQIFTIPPSFADIFLTKMAKLTCVVTNLATYDSLSISWSRQNGEYLKTHSIISESHPNGTFSATGVTSVCVEDWEKGEKFTCTVTHTDLPSPLKQTISRPKEVVKHMPSVYVLPPTREQLSLRESASVTCLVKGFSPADLLVQWMQRGQLMSADAYVTSAPMPEPQAPGTYFAYSILTVSEEDWSAGETYTCVVGHEALPHLVTERTVDKSTGKPTLYNVSLVMSDLAGTCQ